MFGLRRRLACSFCGKNEAQVAKLVAGARLYIRPRAYICDACVAIASRIMEGSAPQGVNTGDQR